MKCTFLLFVFSCTQMEQPELQTKCLLPPHTEEGVLLTQKSAYSPESGFPEAPLHARSPLSTGLEHIKEPRTRGQLLTSIHPSCFVVFMNLQTVFGKFSAIY